MAALMCALLFAALTGLACTKSGTDKEAHADPTSRPATATQPAEEALALDEYLVIALGVDAEFARDAQALLQGLPDPQLDPTGFTAQASSLVSELGRVIGDTRAALAAITPPAEAKLFHDDYIRLLDDLKRVVDRFAVAIERDDFQGISNDLLDLVAVLSGLADVNRRSQELILSAFERKDDTPLNRYLIETIRKRSGVGDALGEYTSSLQSLGADATADDIVLLANDLIASIEEFAATWDTLSPPPEASGLHQQQAVLLDDTLSVLQTLIEALESGDDEALVSALADFQRFAVQGADVGTQWTDLIIQALSAP